MFLSMNSRRLLVVDDIAFNRLVTQALLASASYDVDCAEDGRQALQATMTTAYDLVLMDLDMPVLNGHATAAAMRDREFASDGRWKRPTIIALTADNSEGTRGRSREVGIATHIARPIGPQELLRRIRCFMDALPLAHERQLWCLDTYGDLHRRFGEDRMHTFLTSMRTNSKVLRDVIAVAEPDLVDLRRKAHDMVAVGGMLGFEKLAFTCANVQLLDNAALSRKAILDADQALRDAIQAIDDFLGAGARTRN